MGRLSGNIDNDVRLGRWDPVRISKKGPKLSHLFFADDLTLFASTDDKNCHSINVILQYFHNYAGQRVKL